MTASSLIDRIRSEARSTAERKVAAVLVEGYPVRALTTVEALARQASVSAPTVLRFLSKIGFSRYAEFQAAVREDVERQLGSPLRNLPRSERATSEDPEHIYERTLLMQAEALQVAASQAMPADFAAMADLVASPKASVKLLGGRYSQMLAQRLAMQLKQIRPRVSFQPLETGFLYDALADTGPNDVWLIFDFRRYQPEIFRFAQGAREAGARICLFTDTWRSPVAKFADTVLTSPDDSLSPFGSRVVVTAQIEAIVAAVTQRTMDEIRARLARIEELRAQGNAAEASDEDDEQ